MVASYRKYQNQLFHVEESSIRQFYIPSQRSAIVRMNVLDRVVALSPSLSDIATILIWRNLLVQDALQGALRILHRSANDCYCHSGRNWVEYGVSTAQRRCEPGLERSS